MPGFVFTLHLDIDVNPWLMLYGHVPLAPNIKPLHFPSSRATPTIYCFQIIQILNDFVRLISQLHGTTRETNVARQQKQADPVPVPDQDINLGDIQVQTRQIELGRVTMCVKMQTFSRNFGAFVVEYKA